MGAKISSAGGKGGKRKEMPPNNEPNVIPFIDILLVLLIIFMVAAPLPTVDIRVDLPSAVSTPPPQDQGRRPTFVSVEDTDGLLQFFVGQRETTREALGQTVLEEAIANNPALPVTAIYAEAIIVFRADQDTTYANVVSIMGGLQAEGFAKVSLFSELADI